jgi:Family of unknown function (DUF5318)
MSRSPARIATSPLLIPKSAREVIDYALDRRAKLRELFGGFSSLDADPYLLRAAKHHGLVSDRKCPVCRKEDLFELRYTFGDLLGQYSGRIKSHEEIEEMSQQVGEFQVYIVEVCVKCSWNHLIASYVMGDGIPRAIPRRLPTYE